MKIQKTRKDYNESFMSRSLSVAMADVFAEVLDLEFLPAREPGAEGGWPARLEIEWPHGEVTGGPCLAPHPESKEGDLWWIDFSCSDLPDEEPTRLRELVARYNATERWLERARQTCTVSLLADWLQEERERLQ